MTEDSLIHEINSLAVDIEAYANSLKPAAHALKDGIAMYRMAVKELNRRDSDCQPAARKRRHQTILNTPPDERQCVKIE